MALYQHPQTGGDNEWLEVIHQTTELALLFTVISHGAGKRKNKKGKRQVELTYSTSKVHHLSA